MKFFDFFGLKSPPVDEVHSPPLSCVPYVHDQEEKKPIVAHPRGEVQSPPLMDSWSRSSYLHHQEKSWDREFKETSSAKVVVAREFFPLTPDLNGFLGAKKLGDPCQKIARAQPKRKFMASLTEDETFVEKKAGYNRKQKGKKVASECEEEEERDNGVSHVHDKEEKKPIVAYLRGEVQSPPLMDSWSRSPYLHDQKKSRDRELGETSSAKVAVAREFFPLTPDLNGFLGTEKLEDPCQKITRAQPKRKFMATLTEDETFVEKKARYNRKRKEKKVASEYEAEEEKRNGISTELVLLFDPYKIKKKLTKSDLDHLSRLLIPRACVMSYVLPYMSEETVTRVWTSKGVDVVVWDTDTHSEHRLVLAFWESSGAFVLKGCWIKEFVRRRGLAVRDEIGIYWDPTTNRFHFSLLSKAN